MNCLNRCRDRQFDSVFPYTYTLIRKSDGKQYHGVRWGNVRLGLSPKADFGLRYFSSGIFKREYKKNPENFTAKLRWTFPTIEQSILWESAVNARLMHRSNWENAAIGKCCADVGKLKFRRAAAFLTKYGVDHNFKVKSIRDKRDATIEQLYGVKNVGASPIIRRKVEETSIKKFGVTCSFQSEEVKEKIRAPLQKKFGVDNPRKSAEVQKKMNRNCQEKFGVEFGFQRPDVKEKIAERRLEMYIRLAKMSSEDFDKYLSTISPQLSVQNQKKSQRTKGLKILKENAYG